MREFKHLGNYLRQCRLEQGLTQNELAMRVGVHSQFVSNWERGRCAPPAHVFQNVIRAQKVNREELVQVMLADEEYLIRKKVSRIRL